MKKLLVIIPDHLSTLLEKGEVVPRYYNPRNLFEEVHILMTNEDKPDPAKVQTMVGTAKLYLHNISPPPHFFRNTLGWQFPLMEKWATYIVDLGRKIQPDLIRTHNNFLEGYLAWKLKTALGVPYVTSLHGVWDEDDLRTIKSQIHRLFRKKIEMVTLQNADAVICVYSPIVNYAKRHGAKNPFLIQNFVGGQSIQPKSSWELSNPIQLITVNRQLPDKNPENIIKALRLLPYSFEYTLIGDGILHHKLQLLAKELGLTSQIKFIKSLPNSEVCKLYTKSDFLISNCHYKGISKTVLEAGLTGLPIVLNSYRDNYQLEEYQGGWIQECEDTPEAYAMCLDRLIKNDAKRIDLAKRALEITWAHYSSELLENKIVNLYQGILK